MRAMRAFDLWPTRIASINLVRAAADRVPAIDLEQTNLVLSRLAIDKFREFKDAEEQRARAQGRPAPLPNDLDDGFFSFQVASPAAVRHRVGATARWPELYHEPRARAMLLQLADLIHEACEEYVRRFARPR